VVRWMSGIRDTIAAARPPRPLRTQPVIQRARPRRATLGAVSDIANWLPAAPELNGPVAVVPDFRPTSHPRGSTVSAIAKAVDSPTLPTAPGTDWIRLTDLTGSALTSADIRVDALSMPDILLVTAPVGLSGAARAADALFHSNTQLRAAALPQSGAVELAAWAAPIWLVILQRPAKPIACVTGSAVLAELLTLGCYRLTEKARSIEAVTPWEEPVVQRLFELEFDSAGGKTVLDIDASLSGDRAWIEQLAEIIGAVIVEEGT